MKFRIQSILLFTVTVALSFSCLKDMPEDFPSELVWNPEIAFPVTETSIGMNEESGFDTLLLQPDPITGLPLWVYMVGVPITGDADFNMASIIGNEEEVNRIMVRINAYNGFPAEVLIQAYFMETNNTTPVDSFFVGGPFTLNPGKLKSDNISIAPTYSRADVVFDRDDLDKLSDVTTISFETIILNANLDSTLIPHYTNYHIDVQLACMVDFILNL